MNKKENFLKLLDDELIYLKRQIVFEPDIDRDVYYCIDRIQKLKEKLDEEEMFREELLRK